MMRVFCFQPAFVWSTPPSKNGPRFGLWRISFYLLREITFFGCRCLFVSKTNDTIFKDVKKARRHFHGQVLPKATFFLGEGGNPLKPRLM